MKKLKNSVNLLFFFALASSILFPAGIVSLIFGATQDIIFLFVLGITFTVFCFFGILLLWVFFGIQKSKLSHVQAIMNSKTWNLEVLAKTFGKSKPLVVNELQTLIHKGYLEDYVLTDNFLISRNVENFEELIARYTGNLQAVKCPNCGASSILTYGEGYCPYCGSSLSEKNK